MTKSRRKSIPLKAQLHAALLQLGLDPATAELHHTPALGLRDWDERAQDTVPAANDPRHLVWMSAAAHRTQTFGRGGEKRITTAGSDIHAISKVKRITGETPKKPKRPWPTRKFDNRKERK